MIVGPPVRHAARVEMHLPGGFTRVVLYALAHGDIRKDVPTDKLPPRVRALGAEFVLVRPRFRVEAADSADDIRRMCREFAVEELNTED